MMHKEFAVEPSAVNLLERLQFIESHVGYDRGRLLSSLPEHWSLIVREICSAGLSGINCSRVENLLFEMVKNHVFVKRAVRQHDVWIEQALELLDRSVIDAVIADEQSSPHLDEEQPVYDWFSICDEGTEWHCPTYVSAKRSPDALAGVAARVLQDSQTIVFIDPYFDPVDKRFLAPLKKFLDMVYSDSCFSGANDN